jgi:hypothetical protein
MDTNSTVLQLVSSGAAPRNHPLHDITLWHLDVKERNDRMRRSGEAGDDRLLDTVAQLLPAGLKLDMASCTVDAAEFNAYGTEERWCYLGRHSQALYDCLMHLSQFYQDEPWSGGCVMGVHGMLVDMSCACIYGSADAAIQALEDRGDTPYVQRLFSAVPSAAAWNRFCRGLFNGATKPYYYPDKTGTEPLATCFAPDTNPGEHMVAIRSTTLTDLQLMCLVLPTAKAARAAQLFLTEWMQHGCMQPTLPWPEVCEQAHLTPASCTFSACNEEDAALVAQYLALFGSSPQDRYQAQEVWSALCISPAPTLLACPLCTSIRRRVFQSKCGHHICLTCASRLQRPPECSFCRQPLVPGDAPLETAPLLGALLTRFDPDRGHFLCFDPNSINETLHFACANSGIPRAVLTLYGDAASAYFSAVEDNLIL